MSEGLPNGVQMSEQQINKELEEMTGESSSTPMRVDGGDRPAFTQEDLENAGVHEKPEHVPEKYWNKDTGEVDYESWNKSTTELERRFHEANNNSEEGSEENNQEQTKQEENNNNQETSQQFTQDEMTRYTDEFVKDGTLSDESLKELGEKGFSAEQVQIYLDGLSSRIIRNKENVNNAVGGEEVYKNIMAWADANLSDAEKEAYNKALDGGLESAALAAQGLHAKYQTAVGKDPSLINGLGNGNDLQSDVYESEAQMMADMRDPRYENDEAFRQKVANKLKRSNILGGASQVY